MSLEQLFPESGKGLADYVMMPPMRDFSTHKSKQIQVLATEESGGNQSLWYVVTESKRAMCYNLKNDKITKMTSLYPYTGSIHDENPKTQH